MWQQEQRNRCPGCGHPYDEALDPKLIREWSATVRTCWPCDARARAQDRDRESNGPVVHPEAQRWSVERT